MTRFSLALLLVLAVVATVVVVLAVIDFGESAGAEPGEVTLEQLAEDPAAYRGQTVTVSGEWVDNEYFTPADADLAIPIGDDAGEAVLVLPQQGAAVPSDIEEDTLVRVTGTVRPADASRSGAGFPDESALLSEVQADVVIDATEITTPAVDPTSRTERGAFRVTVEQLLRDPDAYDERSLSVPGRITQIGSGGFVLTERASSIYVSAPYADLGGYEDGERVVIRAELQQLSEFRSEGVPESLVRGRPAGDDAPVDVDAQVPSEVGDPFLVLRETAGQAGG